MTMGPGFAIIRFENFTDIAYTDGTYLEMISLQEPWKFIQDIRRKEET